MKDKKLKENTAHHRVAPRLKAKVKNAGINEEKKEKKERIKK